MDTKNTVINELGGANFTATESILDVASEASVVDNETLFAADIDLISTTDTESRITYANQHFYDVAGYVPDDLIGQYHNVVRHPDMPKSAFKQLWETVQSGQSWMGLVKNKRQDGGFLLGFCVCDSSDR